VNDPSRGRQLACNKLPRESRPQLTCTEKASRAAGCCRDVKSFGATVLRRRPFTVMSPVAGRAARRMADRNCFSASLLERSSGTDFDCLLQRPVLVRRRSCSRHVLDGQQRGVGLQRCRRSRTAFLIASARPSCRCRRRDLSQSAGPGCIERSRVMTSKPSCRASYTSSRTHRARRARRVRPSGPVAARGHRSGVVYSHVIFQRLTVPASSSMTRILGWGIPRSRRTVTAAGRGRDSSDRSPSHRQDGSFGGLADIISDRRVAVISL